MSSTFKFIAPALFASLALGGVAAEAATPNRANAIRAEIAQLDRAASRNDWRGHVSSREAAAIRRDVARLQTQFRDYNRNGLNKREIATLESRIRAIRTQLHMERRGGNHRRG
ncbi:MAG: hypothetical protein M0R03_09270 [Novosphingobium sp.]|nr:hypothetical protein [Novosphingobium sp.]